MERIRQCGTILTQQEFKKGTSAAQSKFLFSKDNGFHCRIEGSSITFWRQGESVPFGGWRFSNGSRIVDACSMPFIDGSDGIVIAVNGSEGKKPAHFIAYYSFTKSSVVKMISIKNELNQGLQNASHWIAVGTVGGSCYLTHFGIDSPSDVDLSIVPPSFSTNVTKSYICDDAFIVDTGQSRFSVKLDAVSVTALCYVPKCWLLLIGLSCGAVIAVGLSKTPTRMTYYMYDGPVQSFAFQEPNDDPRPTFYLWIAFNENERRRTKTPRLCGAQVVLAIIVFPEDEGKPFNEWSYLSPRIQRHFSWSPGMISRWVSFRTIVRNDGADRVALHLDRSSMLDESALSTSPDSTLLLMVWINQKGTAAEGALFDLNALYYKRLIKSVIFDGTVAHQCPFLSLFTLLEDKQLVSDIEDVVACPDTFLRFSGPLSESNDALFYPSALSFSVAVLRTNSHLFVEIRSIQDQLLCAIDADIVDAVGANVNLAAQWMTAVGLADANSTFAANTEWYEPSLVITGLLNHGFASGLKKWLEDSADEASRDDFNKFLWDFVQDTKEHFDENSSGLFARISMAPPKWAASWLKSAYFVFKIAEELFAILHKKLSSGSKKLEAEIECHRRASSNLALYTRFVLFMLRFGVLPESTNYGSIWAQVREKVDERLKHAQMSGKQLFIHELLEEMQRFGEGEGFWVGEDLTSLYPPKTLLALLAPILALNITLAAKLKLMGYFFRDYDLVTKRGVFDRYRNAFLNADKYLAEQIVGRHEADSSEPIKASVNLYTELCDVKKGANVDVKDLVRYPLLSEAQYSAIKDALLKKEDGITEWNNFCIARRQLQRLIEPTKDIKNEQWKNECDQWTKRFLKEIPRLKPDEPIPSVFAKWTAAEESGPPKEFAYVSRRRPRRRTTLHETLVEYKSTMELRKRKAAPAEVTPERKRSEQLDNVSRWNNEVSPVGDTDAVRLEKVLPKENLERVRRILQTPPSARRLGRGGRGAIPLDFDTTPENIATVQPTSILKSAAKRRLHKDSEPGQRLRFELPSGDLERSGASTSEECLLEEETVAEADELSGEAQSSAESYTAPPSDESLPEEEMVVEPGDTNVTKEAEGEAESTIASSSEECLPDEEAAAEADESDAANEVEAQKESTAVSSTEERLPKEEEAAIEPDESNTAEDAEAQEEGTTASSSSECLPSEETIAEPDDDNVAKEGEGQTEIAAIPSPKECLPVKEAVVEPGDSNVAKEGVGQTESIITTSPMECLPVEEADVEPGDSNVAKEDEGQAESATTSSEDHLVGEGTTDESGESNAEKVAETHEEENLARRLRSASRSPTRSTYTREEVLVEQETPRKRGRSRSPSRSAMAADDPLMEKKAPRRRGGSRSPSRSTADEPVAEKKTPRKRVIASRIPVDFAPDEPKRTREGSVVSVASAPENIPRKRDGASRSPRTPSKRLQRAASEVPAGFKASSGSKTRRGIRAGRNVATSSPEDLLIDKRRTGRSGESNAIKAAETHDEENISRRLRSASRSPTRSTITREEVLVEQETPRKRGRPRSPSRALMGADEQPVIEKKTPQRRGPSRSPSRSTVDEPVAEKKTPQKRSIASRIPVLDFAPDEPKRTREGSVMSVASAPENTPRKRGGASRSPSRTPSKRIQRAASEAPAGSDEASSGTGGRRRIRAGRKPIAEVLGTIEEERKNTPTRSSSRSRKIPERYPK